VIGGSWFIAYHCAGVLFGEGAGLHTQYSKSLLTTEMVTKQSEWTIAFISLILVAYGATAIAQVPSEDLAHRRAIHLGGWTDQVVFRNWRIQCHAIIGHHRLVAPNGRLQAIGSYTLEKRPKVSFQRFVMISPPNHGAEIVDVVNELVSQRNGIRSAAEILAGQASTQLAPHGGWVELEKTLKVPDFDFAVIAGGQGDDDGYLLDLPGDDDGLLSIDTMKLAGASDFIQVKGLHMVMPQNKEVQKLTFNFLKHGFFLSSDRRQPLK
jgi:hypothetical protein